jgi:glycosyltransferase involved in cell wall biosynthesis
MIVVYFIDTLNTGGAEKSILEISKRLKKIKPVICVLFSGNHHLYEDFKKSGIKVINLNISKKDKLWFFKGKKKFEKICLNLQPDIVHAHLFKSEMIARFSKLPKKTILVGAYVNDSYSPIRYKNQSFTRNVKLKFIEKIDKLTINRNNYITAITNTVANNNNSILNFDKQKTKIIYRGRKIQNSNSIQRNFNPNKIFKFLAIGRLLKRKGYYDIIDAVEILKKTSPTPFIVQIAGDGVDKKSIQTYAQKKGVNSQIFFLGNRNDVDELLNQSHCFIFASHYEGQGGALIEAMISEIPIIASNIKVFKEQVENDISAKLFKVRNASDLADKMKWVINNYNDALKLGKNARSIAEKKFNIDEIAKQTENFYLEIISNKQ